MVKELGIVVIFSLVILMKVLVKNVIGILLDDGKSRFCGNVGKGVFLFVFVAVGTLCGQEFMYCSTELGSGI